MLVIIRLNSCNRLKFYNFALSPIKKPFSAREIETTTLPVLWLP